jgi:hypothetical protein
MSSPVDTEKQQTRFEEAASTTAGDTEKGSAYANSTTGLDHQKGLKEQERRILRKLDVVILPLTALLYVSQRSLLFLPKLIKSLLAALRLP